MSIRLGRDVVSSSIWTQDAKVKLQGRKGDKPRAWSWHPKKARSVRVCREVPKNTLNERLAIGQVNEALHEAYTQGWKYSPM